ncbi:MAG: hypothetical protein AAB649_07220, partial [Patescibacteria group bacterium]
SLLILLMYLRTAGYYRYFFTAQLLGLIYLLPSILQVTMARYAKQVIVLFTILVLFHTHQTFFNSWVSVHIDTHRSALLSQYVGNITAEKKTLFYQAPEAVNFLPSSNQNYYQYISITTALENGKKQIDVLEKGEPDIVITNSDLLENPIFSKYKVETLFDQYAILLKK